MWSAANMSSKTVLRYDNICTQEVNQGLPIEYDRAYYDMSEKWILKMFDAHLKAYYHEKQSTSAWYNQTIVTFDDLHQVLQHFENISNGNSELFHSFQSIMEALDINRDVVLYRTGLLKDMIIFIAYLLLIIISLFGNLLVLFIILSRRQLRQQTTNKLIANLTMSDLLLTTFNIPLTVVRLLFDSWPLGLTFCYLGPLVQAMSVYVSTLSMVVIAIDRHQMLLGSMLLRRFSSSLARGWMLVAIWIVSAIFSIPHFIFNRVVTKQTYTCVLRCEAKYPSAALSYSRGITVFQLLSQYLVPLTIITFCYSQIGIHIWKRASIGAMTRSQKNSYAQSKRRTLKMLILVVIVFAICWLPLNLYFFYLDFLPNTVYSKSLYTFSHWCAMSSVCYNPFIYFWLNKQYKERARALLPCCFGWRTRASSNSSMIISAADRFEVRSETLDNGHARGMSKRFRDKQYNRADAPLQLNPVRLKKSSSLSGDEMRGLQDVKFKKTQVDRWGKVRPLSSALYADHPSRQIHSIETNVAVDKVSL